MERIWLKLEFEGEFDKKTDLLAGIWVSFPGSWRIPSLFRDVDALIQALRDYCRTCPEDAFGNLTLLQPEEHIVCQELFDDEILNALGNPLDWQL